MSTSELLTRSVSKVIPQQLAEKKIADNKKIRMYWGIDPTGSRIHLGHAVALRKMKQLADDGHEVILLIGSFTAMIGDPTGRDAMREPLTFEDVQKNFETYKEQAEKILDFSKVLIRFNNEWLDQLSPRDFLHLASHFTVNQMIERDMFEKRLEEGKPVSVTEFFYPLLVGYDSVVLDVDMELGGTDQEFNMLAGRTLQKAFGKREKFIMTLKLLEGTDGRKMSKTYDNCIYLDESPKDMFGKTMSINDSLIATYMECCTNIPMDEIADAEKAMKQGANPKEFKVMLAKAIVELYHGEEAAKQAEAEFNAVFAKGGVPEDIEEYAATSNETLIDLLTRTKTVSSKSDARRLVNQGAISIDGTVITSLDHPAEKGVVKVGKKRFIKIV